MGEFSEQDERGTDFKSCSIPSPPLGHISVRKKNLDAPEANIIDITFYPPSWETERNAEGFKKRSV